MGFMTPQTALLPLFRPGSCRRSWQCCGPQSSIFWRLSSWAQRSPRPSARVLRGHGWLVWRDRVGCTHLVVGTADLIIACSHWGLRGCSHGTRLASYRCCLGFLGHHSPRLVQDARLHCCCPHDWGGSRPFIYDSRSLAAAA